MYLAPRTLLLTHSLTHSPTHSLTDWLQIEQWQELLGRFVVDRATPIQLALIQVLGAHCLTLVRADEELFCSVG